MTIPRLPGQLSHSAYYVMGAQAPAAIFKNIPEDHQVIGPVEQKWAVNLAPVSSASALATGVGAEEKRASYRLTREPGNSDLSGARPMNSPKSFNFLSREPLLTAERINGETRFETPAIETRKKAFFGLHSCDIAGLFVMDRTFSKRYGDPAYDSRRENTLVIGVGCSKPGANCFCSTFDTGPDLKSGFDIGLTWLGDKYLVEVATEAGERIVSALPKEPAGPDAMRERDKKTADARRSMTKAFDLKKALTVLNDNYDHPYWNEPSERCLSCGNCINVCPTCYCYRVVDETSLDGKTATRTRVWDACQHLEFSAVHGGNFRPERVDRIRQWVNHKINWTIEQYGVSGCVGCGRCITWCPTAIDITEPVWRLGGKHIGLAA